MTQGALLNVSELRTGYATKRVIDGVSLYVGIGEIVAVIGHNGAGKSTFFKAMFGLLPIWSGRIEYREKSFNGLHPAARMRAGFVYAPQGNRVFTELTVKENLDLAAAALFARRAEQAQATTRMVERYPVLSNRLGTLAGSLSGGQRQILALASTLVGRPQLALLDEPTLGLAPRMASEALDHIADIRSRTGCSFLIIEQKIRDVIRIADRAYVLREGKISHSGPAEPLRDDQFLKSVYL